MNRSTRPTNGKRRHRRWFRRGHRWVGVSAVVFVLFLAISGITLNHANDLGLDRRYVSWSWLLDAYGIHAPEPAASFSDSGYRVSLLGDRLFLNGRDSGQRLMKLAGLVAIEPLVLAAGDQTAHLFTSEGHAVEAIDLAAILPGPIESVGRVDGRAVVRSAGQLFLSDAEIASFEPWQGDIGAAIEWSAATPIDAAELQALDAAWRGQGVTVERLLLDLHSGRLLDVPGVLLMDLVALCMIVLGLSGLVLSRSRDRRENGHRGNGRR